MADYWGVLTVEHLQAVVRVALRAHGFAMSASEIEGIVRQRRALGALLIGSETGPASADRVLWSASATRAMADAQPALVARLAPSLALGWQQAALFQQLLSHDARSDRRRVALSSVARDSARLGALFNAIISVLDHIADEVPQGQAIFGLLTPELLRIIFDLRVDPTRALADATRAATSAPPSAEGGESPPGVLSTRVSSSRVLLLELVNAWSRLGRRLAARCGDDERWQELGDTLTRLLAAEARSCASAASAADMRWKSVGPSIALMQIGALGRAREAPSAALHALAVRLGTVFWRADDAMDLLPDSVRRVPSSLLVAAAARAAADGRTTLNDVDLYRTIDRAAADLAALLEGEALDELDIAAAPDTAQWARAQSFARGVVAEWCDWRGDAPVAHVARSPAPAEQRAARLALEALSTAQQTGYSEAAHHLHLPRVDGRAETHTAISWFRAVALDALLDARDARLPVDDAAIHRDVLALLCAKHPLVRGGWSYIPAVEELPPDADDTGMVMQVLARVGGALLAASAEEPARLLLDTSPTPGGVLTWAIDPRGESAADMAVQAYCLVMGGVGVHAEVVANFGVGLARYDVSRFGWPLQDIASYVESVQEPNGSWTSVWYDGAYYGTYRAVALLQLVRPGSASARRARDFVLTHQGADGSWGDGEGRALATAFAMLVLAEMGGATDPARIRGSDYLRRVQRENGTWPAAPWIRFPTTDGVVAHGSITMTTAFCLKALLPLVGAHES